MNGSAQLDELLAREIERRLGPVQVAVAKTPNLPAKALPAATTTKPRPVSKPAAPKTTIRQPVKSAPAETITTLTGATYKNVMVEKKQADGIVISYRPDQGGMAMTKVYYEELPSELQQKYKGK